MKLGIIITRIEPEAVFNILRLALFSLKKGDEVKIFLLGKGVDIETIVDPQFDVASESKQVLEAGGKFFACGTCLKLRHSEGSNVCPISTMNDCYEIVRDSDKLVTI